jgi:hypothetical protein
LGVAAVVALLSLGLGWWQVMAPAPAPPELSERRAPLPVRTEAAPAAGTVLVQVWTPDRQPAAGQAVHVSRDPGPDASPELAGLTDETGQLRLELDGMVSVRIDGITVPDHHLARPGSAPLRFTLVPACPVRARVVDAEGDPMEGIVVKALLRTAPDAPDAARTEATTDAEGVASLESLGCGVAELWARARGHALVRRRDVDTVVEQEVVLQLVRGLVVEGRVSDPDDAPLAGVRVNAGESSDLTDEEGLYRLRVNPVHLTHIVARSAAHAPYSSRLRVPKDATENGPLVHDIVMDPARELSVWCAGMPSDSCAGISPIFCTHPALPTGTECTPTDDHEVRCRCPAGRAAVRGGGTNTRVEPGDTEAWLDLRDRGGITGRVVQDGAPVGCRVRGTRMPAGLEDIPGGLAAGTIGLCDAEGRYTMVGMKAGDWMVSVEVAGEVRNLDPLPVEGELVDAGTLELSSGHAISGVVVDGATGEGRPGVTVVALDETGAVPRVGHAVSGTEGRFAVTGLSNGDYEVFLANRPFERTAVSVPGDDDDVELETGAAPLLERNGFSLATAAEGELVVDEVEEGSAAAANGLEAGDVVLGVTIGGVDVGETVPGLAADVTDFVLDRWGGPGAGLVVERDGERVEVPLE